VAPAAEFPYPYTQEDALRFIENAKASESFGAELHFGIHLNNSNELVGAATIFNIDKESRTCKIGYWLRREHWGKGYAREALISLIEFAFKKVGVDKICADVFNFNLKSINLLAGLGFRENPMYRSVVSHYGGYAEELRYELSFDGKQNAD
jgi:RimJ/RimL family protein N-acetyltransferase